MNWCSITGVKILRVLAVCLLMLAIPLQGFAAASQAFCHARQSAAAHEVMHSSHGHEQASADHHEQAGDHADSPSLELNHKCNHCSLCGAALALAFFAPTHFTAVSTPSSLVAFLPQLHDSITLRGLERPPRLTSA